MSGSLEKFMEMGQEVKGAEDRELTTGFGPKVITGDHNGGVRCHPYLR